MKSRIGSATLPILAVHSPSGHINVGITVEMTSETYLATQILPLPVKLISLMYKYLDGNNYNNNMIELSR